MSPLSYEAIDRYCIRHGIRDADRYDEFVYLIQHLDGIVLKHANKKPKKGKRK